MLAQRLGGSTKIVLASACSACSDMRHSPLSCVSLLCYKADEASLPMTSPTGSSANSHILIQLEDN